MRRAWPKEGADTRPFERTETRVSVAPETAAAAQRMEAWCGAGKPERKRGKRNWKGAMTNAIAETKEMIAKRGWSWAEPKHLVALYAVLHEQVYGVEAAELVEGWPAAVSAAARLVREEFDDKVHAAVEYLRWVWARERAREKGREAGQGTRIGWGLMFAKRTLLVDFKVGRERARRAVPGKAGAS